MAKNPSARIVVSIGTSGDSFGKDISEVARKYNYPVVDMMEVLSQPGMRATGLFKHKGVSSHPSDKGMAALAEQYARALNVVK